ncbi:unnamed protein product [Choristocarpus tenellus]
MTPATLSDDDLQQLYAWVDEISLSRPKRNISRDFSDGVLVAEVVAYYFPKMVELHNYAAANSLDQKMYNWNTLNEKVLKKMQYQISKAELDSIVHCKSGEIEKVLYTLQLKMAKHRARMKAGMTSRTSPSVEQPSIEGNGGKGWYSGRVGEQSQLAAKVSLASPLSAGLRIDSALSRQESMTRDSTEEGPKASQSFLAEGLISDKDNEIRDLRETNEILRLKISKLEQLVRLKDSKINKMRQAAQRLGQSHFQQHHQQQQPP